MGRAAGCYTRVLWDLGLLVARASHCCSEHTAAVGRQLLNLLKEILGLPFLVAGEVLPGFHPVQDAFLLFGGQTREVLQALQELRLPLRRELLKVRIVLQRLALLVGRKILVAAKPVSSVVL